LKIAVVIQESLNFIDPLIPSVAAKKPQKSRSGAMVLLFSDLAI
jgi:hypothetical protein